MKIYVSKRKNIFSDYELDDPVRLSSMKYFNAEDIEKLFHALSKELAETSDSNTRYSVYLTGGGALMLSLGERRTTTDIDVLFEKNERIIHECAIKVSDDLGIVRGWCNDLVKLSGSYTPAICIYSHLFKSYGCLDVYTVDADLILCMKLISFRGKDIEDINFLINYLNEHGADLTMDNLNKWFKKYYDDFGRKPKFKKSAVAFIREVFL